MRFPNTLLLLKPCRGIIFSRGIKVDTASYRGLPGLESPLKLWWLKEITPEYFISGRLTPRQIKYIPEGGFKSIVSLFSYDNASQFGGEELPTSSDATKVADIAGLEYKVVLNKNEKWPSVESVTKFSNMLAEVPKPVVVSSDRGYSATFAILAHMANRTKNDGTFEPKVSTERFYRIAAAMGFDYTGNVHKEILSKITGDDVMENPPKPEVDVKEWYDYWHAHPVFKNWFTAGQIRKSQVPSIMGIGYTAMVNMRPAVTTDGVPTQESVALLNILDASPTYGNERLGPRQDLETLKKTRFNPERKNEFISSDSKYNFEVKNEEEFGDDVGLNVDIEAEYFKELGYPYYHMPVVLQVPYTPEVFGKYKDTLLKLGEKGPVLIHCAIGMRAGFFAVLAAALQHGKDMNWALKRIRELGFEVSPTVNEDVYNMYAAWLNKEGNTQETK